MVNFWKDKKVIVTGGNGFLGTHLVKELNSRGCLPIVPNSKVLDLRFPLYIDTLLKDRKVDILFHLAGNVGGIEYNQVNPYSLFYDNAIMGINLIHAAIKHNVKKFVQIGTVCSYPSDTPVPFNETDLWEGYPELTNAPYGIAKKVLLTQLQAARNEFGFNGIYLIPTNLYGPGDNFSDKKSHVIPALIKKFIKARDSNSDYVEVWGDEGEVSRDFIYVKDAANAIVKAAESYNKAECLNVGSQAEVFMWELAAKIKVLTKYKGGIRWDDSKLEGQQRRVLDTSRAKRELKWEAKTTLQNGLIETIEWYERSMNAKS